MNWSPESNGRTLMTQWSHVGKLSKVLKKVTFSKIMTVSQTNGSWSARVRRVKDTLGKFRSIRKAITSTFTLFSCLTSRVHLLHVLLQNVVSKLAPFGLGRQHTLGTRQTQSIQVDEKQLLKQGTGSPTTPLSTQQFLSKHYNISWSLQSDYLLFYSEVLDQAESQHFVLNHRTE